MVISPFKELLPLLISILFATRLSIVPLALPLKLNTLFHVFNSGAEIISVNPQPLPVPSTNAMTIRKAYQDFAQGNVPAVFAAFDANIIGVRPDFAVEVRRDVLDEIDGPMLRHGLQGVHGVHIWTPRASELRPTPARLEERYELFRRAS